MKRVVVTAMLVSVGLAAAGCSRNPILGNWEIDPADNWRAAMLATRAADMESLTFRRTAVESDGTQIDASYAVEEGRVRVIRKDGRGEHLVELLPDGRIRVELPIGVTAVYRKAGG